MDTHDLKQRTIARDGAVWENMNPVLHMGIQNPVSSDDEALNIVGVGGVMATMSIVDDDIRVREDQLNDKIALGAAVLANDLSITEAKHVTSRTILAMQVATNSYVLLTDRYMVSVKDLLADARDYALIVEQKTVPLGQAKATLAEDKGAAKVEKLTMEILLEGIKRKHVEIDLLKAEMDVVRADIKIVMANIGISEAELKVVEAKVRLAMTDIEKVTLVADVALIYADIATRALTQTKYNIESAEILAAYGRISDKLASILAILDLKQESVIDKISVQEDLKADAESLYTAKHEREGLNLEMAEAKQTLQEFEEAKVLEAVREEERLKAEKLASQIDFEDERSTGAHRIDLASVSAAETTQYSHTDSTSEVTSNVISESEIAQAISSG